MSIEATANCDYCRGLFYDISQCTAHTFSREQLARNAAETGCEVCSILPEAVRQVAEAARREEPGDTAYEDILWRNAKITGSTFLQTSRYLKSGVGDFEFYYLNESGDQLHDNLLSKMFHSRPHRIKDASSAEAQELWRRWYECCKSDHPACAQELSYLPTRIIMSGNVATGPRLKLVESPHLKAEYAALSYRWFSDSPFKLTAANHSSYREEIPCLEMPAIFLDAVTVCISLDIQYIWIDSLCILQDSQKDWVVESNRMHNVYRNASLVIGASMPESATMDTGFLKPRPKHLIEEVGTLTAPRSPEKPLTIYMRPYIRHLRVATAENPLASRGWTYQEAHLARRYLLFKPDEMEWKCEVVSKCECGLPSYVADSKHDFSLQGMLDTSSRREIYDAWSHKVVYLYSGRELTFENDKLPALSGVAKFFQIKLQDEYLAGIWRGDALKGLCWRVYDNDSRTQLPTEYRAPSWSWTSVNAHIAYSDSPIVKEFAEVIDAKCKVVSGSSLGCVLSGHVTIRGPVAEASIQFPRKGVIQSSSITFATKTSWIDNLSSFWPDAGVSTERDLSFLSPDDEPLEIESHRVSFREGVEDYRVFLDKTYVKIKVYCVCIGITENDSGYKEVIGLVLTRSQKIGDHFRRLGMMREWTSSLDQPFEKAEIRTVTIV